MTRQALLEKPLTQLIVKEDQDTYYLRRQQLLQTGTPQAFKLRMVKHDNTVFWARLNAAASQDAAGTPTCRIMLDDISRHKRQEMALLESERRFRQLFADHSAVKLIIDAKTGQIVDANQAAASFYGWTIEKLKQMRIQDINTLPPEIVQAEIDKTAILKAARLEFRHRRADGSIRDVEVFSNKIEVAGQDFLYSIVHDITERKRTTELLQASELRFRTILQDIPSIAVQGYAADGTVQYWNHASELLYGYSAQEAVGRSLLDLIIPPEMRGEVEQAIRQMSETRQPIPASKLSLMRKDGSRIAVFSSHAVFQMPGRKQEFFCIDIDLTEYKIAEKAMLRLTAELMATNNRVENEKRLLSAVMEALPTGVAITDVRGGTIQSNSAYRRVWGESLSDTRSIKDYVAYKAWWDDTGKPVAPEEWASAIAIQKQDSVVGQLMRIERFDGSEAFILNSAAAVYDVEGIFFGSAVTVQDVTELKRIEHELKEKENDFARAQEVGSIGSWRLDCLRNELSWSEENYRIFGIPIGTGLKYETFLSIVHPDDRTHVDSRWKAALGGEPYDIEHRLVVDDRIKWVREKAYLEFSKEGTPIVAFGITQDITERKHAELLLQKNQEEMQVILDASPIMIFYKDCENRFIRVNQTMAEVTGLSKEALEGKNLSEIFANQAENYWQDDKEVIASGKPKVGIIEPIDAAIGRRWVCTDKFPYKDKDGRIIGIIGFAVDITERKQAEEQLQAINSELERRVERRTQELQETQIQYLHAEKLAAIGKLSASIAHEFNNPLQGIMSILKGLKKRAILAKEDRDLLFAAADECDRMRLLIRSLQDFNRPSSGKKMSMDVHKSIDSLLMLYRSDFKGKRISVVLNYAERLPQILAIPDQIKQVFLNLLANAADACMQPGGVITITTWQVKEKVAVAIKDTGVGIKSEKIDQIFQPFYTTKPAVKGTGLGLSVSHGIIKSHHGEIRVTSQQGEGATFTVLLPIKGE